jgi:D-alanyl-lipoteichoic acid acyltransferase DltB (MBOAT superfamily)
MLGGRRQPDDFLGTSAADDPTGSEPRMVFSSSIFILVFLPILLALVWLARYCLPSRPAVSTRLVLVLLALGSFAFYAYWDWRFLPLLLGSILVNHLIAKWLLGVGAHGRIVLALGIALNLAWLAYFSSVDFYLGNPAVLAQTEIGLVGTLLPLGITIFTIQQIAFLVDVRKEQRHDYPLLDYTLFVAFFPQLIAGPITHHKEMMPQLRVPQLGAFDLQNVNRGLTIFIIGLAKKVLIADSLAPYADQIFAAAATGAPISAFEAWGGALAYGLQLYFDFSGYADMAIGLALLVGIRFPENFAQPYAATSIGAFWRRWHMTLARFLRDYLYIPLGGARHGPARELSAVMVTMLLGGLWYGVGWTFVLWGALHGGYLVVERVWSRLGEAFGRPEWPPELARPLGWTLTMVAVTFAWVPFRAESIEATLLLWQAMLAGPVFPEAIGALVGERAAGLLAGLGITGHGPMHLDPHDWMLLLPLLLGLLALAMILPNGHALGERVHDPLNPALALSRRYAVACGTVAALLFVGSLLYASDTPLPGDLYNKERPF